MSDRLKELQVLLDHLSNETNLLQQAKLRRQIQKLFKEQDERVEELEKQLKTKLSQWSRACQKKDEFELKSYRYKQALEFYANENNYIHDEWKPLNPNAKSIKMSQVEFDDGEKARQALEGTE